MWALEVRVNACLYGGALAIDIKSAHKEQGFCITANTGVSLSTIALQSKAHTEIQTEEFDPGS
ncbi:MAG TPA: hypothetical protein VK082_00920, partial [Paenalcaligenes sp.]|nr:hypothetical protein [Paenalcaligenes sp.]